MKSVVKPSLSKDGHGIQVFDSTIYENKSWELGYASKYRPSIYNSYTHKHKRFLLKSNLWSHYWVVFTWPEGQAKSSRRRNYDQQ